MVPVAPSRMVVIYSDRGGPRKIITNVNNPRGIYQGAASKCLLHVAGTKPTYIIRKMTRRLPARVSQAARVHFLAFVLVGKLQQLEMRGSTCLFWENIVPVLLHASLHVCRCDVYCVCVCVCQCVCESECCMSEW